MPWGQDGRDPGPKPECRRNNNPFITLAGHAAPIGVGGRPFREPAVKAVNGIAMILLVVGGLNCGLVGLFQVDLVAAVFGAGSTLARTVYVLVRLSAQWGLCLLGPLTRGSDETRSVRS